MCWRTEDPHNQGCRRSERALWPGLPPLREASPLSCPTAANNHSRQPSWAEPPAQRPETRSRILRSTAPRCKDPSENCSWLSPPRDAQQSPGATAREIYWRVWPLSRRDYKQGRSVRRPGRRRAPNDKTANDILSGNQASNKIEDPQHCRRAAEPCKDGAVASRNGQASRNQGVAGAYRSTL